MRTRVCVRESEDREEGRGREKWRKFIQTHLSVRVHARLKD